MNPLFHRHLILAYSVTWIIHLGYLGFVLLKWKAANKLREK
jgi:hypothetical protein